MHEAPVELTATDVGVIFPGRGGSLPVNALTGVTFDVRHGDRISILGRNGSGKSTLLRTLAGIYVPTCGAVSAHRSVAGLFEYWQGMHLESTGWENAVTLGTLQGRSRAEIEGARPAIMAMAGLSAVIDRPIRGWSPGMMLRLAFTVATAWQPEILLVDEVLSVADAGFTEMARARLLELSKEAAAILLAGHDLSLHRAIANRALVFDRGQLVFDGGIEAAISFYQRAESETVWNA